MAKNLSHAPEPSFEAALLRLEQIVAEMESDRLPLEDLLARYEEGNTLVKVCQSRLSAAEKRIEQIARGADGAVHLEPFEQTTQPAAAPAPAAAPVASPRAAATKKPAASVEADDVRLF